MGADLFTFHEETYVIDVDYWSDYFEFVQLPDTHSSTILTSIKSQFSWHGIPDTHMSDNASQFVSDEFKKFASLWQFDHDTSLPIYPQSYGKIDNSASKDRKETHEKGKADSKDPYLAILDWRNTPSEGVGLSPVQRLF